MANAKPATLVSMVENKIPRTDDNENKNVQLEEYLTVCHDKFPTCVELRFFKLGSANAWLFCVVFIAATNSTLPSQRIKRIDLNHVFQKYLHILCSHQESSSAAVNEMEVTSNDLSTPLSRKGFAVSDILQRMVSIVSHPDSPLPHGLEFNDIGHLAVLSRGLACYLASVLDKNQLTKLANRTTIDTNTWLSKIFRYEKGALYFHEEAGDGLIKVGRLTLLTKCPKFQSEGFHALYARPPVIYISSAAPASLGKYLCSQLGLPYSCLSIVPCVASSSTFDETMDLASLERSLNEDVACGKTPLLLIAYGGTPMCGQNDNTSYLRELCDKYNLWLHLEGNGLALLALEKPPASYEACRKATSITLRLSDWFNWPGVSYCTLYRSSDSDACNIAGMTNSETLMKLHGLSLWISMQYLGQDAMAKMVNFGTELAQQLIHRLDLMKDVTRLQQENSVNPVVVFRYKPNSKSNESNHNLSTPPDDLSSTVKKDSVEETNSGIVTTVSNLVLDSYNKLLLYHLSQSVRSMHIELIELSKDGYWLKFDPIKTAIKYKTTQDDVDEFISCLRDEITVMNVTINSKSEFETAIKSNKRLKLAEVHQVTGLGAVQFVPEYLVHDDIDTVKLTDRKRSALKKVNRLLAETLEEQDKALFALVTTTDDYPCVAVGMISQPEKIPNIIDTIIQKASELDDNSQLLEEMSELIKKSIAATQETLKQEAEDYFWEEGVYRQVPLISTVMNWWSPPTKTAIPGRTLNLSKGTVESTEPTYELKMQVQQSFDDDNSS
ncbi:Pyridoxal-dependent decarboxylase domain-containing protein 1 [Trichoplax sp. H2]|nr:Pyridoxal-dependent decarboxylase domain-containing protein 1 [Trichoplax sp. H2]|eukprot:RDD45321.1 Pyridoxal-dependent decarboxylase domain-containing protein 1 [Trichoplax sp. H2]